MDGVLDFLRLVLDKAGTLGVAGLGLLGWFGGMAWYRPETLERWAAAIDDRIGDQWPLVIMGVALGLCWSIGAIRDRARDRALDRWFHEDAQSKIHVSHALTSLEQTVGSCAMAQPTKQPAESDG